MGANNSIFGRKNSSSILARAQAPPYCLKSIGSRHFLVGCGGGAAKTGVANEIDLFLLTYNNDLSMQESQPIIGGRQKLQAKQAGSINTSTYANMNIDAIALGEADSGRYLIVAGQDQYCSLFEATEFSLFRGDGEDVDSAAKLSFDFRNVCRIVTDKSARDPYQKCVKLYRCRDRVWMASGGVDGVIRLWNVSSMLAWQKEKKVLGSCSLSFESESMPDQPELEIDMQSEVDDLDVSECGSILAAVRSLGATTLYGTDGNELVKLHNPSVLGDNFKVRSIKFLAGSMDVGRVDFITAYNQRVRTSKEVSYLARWTYAMGECKLVSIERACYETISCLATSEGGNYAAIGTMGGSVAIFSSCNLRRPLLFASKVHSSFVTSVEFLRRDNRSFLKMDASGAELAQANSKSLSSRVGTHHLTSASIDQSLCLHSMDLRCSTLLSTKTGLVLKLALSSLVLYLLLWFIFVH